MKLFSHRRLRPAQPEAEKVRFVVVEDGARGFESLVVPDGGDETIVVAQTGGEAPADLTHRVVERLAGIERSKRIIDRAVIVVGPGPQEQAARGAIARALLSSMVASGVGELVFAAEGAAAEVRQELLSLVESIVADAKHATVPIRLQFRREAPVPLASGVFPIAEARLAPAIAG